MKKFWIMFVLLLTVSANATTVNLNWVVDDTAYTTTTCETGGDLILPATPPAKYGYTFKGWREYILYGTFARNGTPTPANPIYPTFYQNGDLILRSLGDGITDDYNPVTKTITRRVGVITFKGNEAWQMANTYYIKSDATDAFYIISNMSNAIKTKCSHAEQTGYDVWAYTGYPNLFKINADQFHLNIANDVLGITDYTQETQSTALQKFKAFLTAQYNAGTPVTVYYPLAEPVEETFNGQIL